MIKKKSLTVFLTVLILLSFSIVISAYENDTGKVLATKTPSLAYGSTQRNVITSKISQKDAVKIAQASIKKYFNFEFDTKKYQANIQLTTNEPSSDTAIWLLSWYGYFNSTNYNLNCYLDANSGKILKLGKNEDTNEKKPLTATYNIAKARKNAEAFVEKINPGALKASKQVNKIYNYNYDGTKPVYTFTYSRVVKGISFDENTITVICDGINGKVTNYSYDWVDTLKFPTSTAVIKLQAAHETLIKELSLEPRYISYRNSKLSPEKPVQIKLVYEPNFEKGSAVDALSGKITRFAQYEQNMIKLDLTEKDCTSFLNNYKDVVMLEKELDKTEAAETMSNILKELLGDIVTVNLDNLSYQDNSNNNGSTKVSIWSGQFYGKSDRTISGSISIAASSGELISLFMNHGAANQESFTPKLTWSEAYSKAINLIAKGFPSMLKELDTKQTYYNGKIYSKGKLIPPQQYFFIFQRKVNNLDYLDNSIQVSINPKTGELSNLNSIWDRNLVFPKLNNLINVENAKKLYFDKFKPILSYITFDRSVAIGKPDKIVKLAYLLRLGNYSTTNTEVFIDGFTGRFLDYSGEAIYK